MRATERAPGDPFHVLERRHGLVEIVDRRTGVHAERTAIRLYSGGNNHLRWLVDFSGDEVESNQTFRDDC